MDGSMNWNKQSIRRISGLLMRAFILRIFDYHDYLNAVNVGTHMCNREFPKVSIIYFVCLFVYIMISYNWLIFDFNPVVILGWWIQGYLHSVVGCLSSGGVFLNFVSPKFTFWVSFIVSLFLIGFCWVFAVIFCCVYIVWRIWLLMGLWFLFCSSLLLFMWFYHRYLWLFVICSFGLLLSEWNLSFGCVMWDWIWLVGNLMYFDFNKIFVIIFELLVSKTIYVFLIIVLMFVFLKVFLNYLFRNYFRGLYDDTDRSFLRTNSDYFYKANVDAFKNNRSWVYVKEFMFRFFLPLSFRYYLNSIILFFRYRVWSVFNFNRRTVQRGSYVDIDSSMDLVFFRLHYHDCDCCILKSM